MALLLNLTSFRIPPYTVIRDEQPFTAILDGILETLADPSAPFEALQEAKDLAEAINEGDLP